MCIFFDATIESRMTRALSVLPDARLDDAAARHAVYPMTADELPVPAMFEFFDAAALRAERLRRDLRVGAGFGALRRAA